MIDTRSLTQNYYLLRFQNDFGLPSDLNPPKQKEKTKIQPHWFTMEAIRDYESRAIAFTGGVGSGKTDGAVLWHWHRCRLNFRSQFSWVVSPTYGKLWDSVIPRYTDFLKNMGYIRGIHFTLYKSPLVRLIYKYSGHEVHFHGADRPDLMVATEISHCLIEEPGRMKGQVFTEVEERTRCRRAVVRQILFSGVPQGVNEYADMFNF